MVIVADIWNIIIITNETSFLLLKSYSVKRANLFKQREAEDRRASTVGIIYIYIFIAFYTHTQMYVYAWML